MSSLKDGKKEFYRHLHLDKETLQMIYWFRLLKIAMMRDMG